MPLFSDQDRLTAARKLFESVGILINARISIRLWDGSMIPLGSDVDPRFFISISGAGVLGALMRKPTYENLLFHYANGYIDIHGDLIDFAAIAREKHPKDKLKKISKLQMLKQAFRFFWLL